MSAIAAMLLLAACGGGGETSEKAGGADRQTRTVTHVYGQTEVPVEAQRVVVLDDNSILGTALALDVPVVGATLQPFGEGILPYFDDNTLGEVTDVGYIEIDVERVASLDPDLIVGDTGQVEEEALYPLLAAIAPTVIFEHFGDTPWKQGVGEAAAVFGDEEEFAQRLAEYDERVAELRATLGGTADELTVSLANLRALDDIRIYPDEWCSGQILAEVGFERPANQADLDDTAELSIERLPEIDAEVLFYFLGSSATDPTEAGRAEAEIIGHPLWANLGAVQAERAFPVPSEHWFTCSSLQAAHLVLDDISELLAG